MTTKTDDMLLSYFHYFGDIAPGEVHRQLCGARNDLADAYAEIERLKTKVSHSDGTPWKDLAIRERMMCSHTKGLMRVLVYSASGTQESPDSEEVARQRAAYIRRALPANPNVAAEIATIVGVELEPEVPFTLKPMATAPKPKEDEDLRLLVVDEWYEMGKPCRGYAFVYWLDAFDGRPEGWYGKNGSDLRHPVGWILSTRDLPQV